MTTQDNKTRRVQTIDKVQLHELSIDPRLGYFFVLAEGTANSSASNARLIVSSKPSVGTNLLLELVADHGGSPVMTPVSAARRFNLDGYMTVTVLGGENQKTVEVPKPSRAEAAKVPTEDFSQRRWRATHFLDNEVPPQPVIPGSLLTAHFSGPISGTVKGSGGCNTYGASFVWQPGAPNSSINIYDLIHTRLHCEGLMEQERRFFAYLQQAREIEYKGEILELRSGPSGASTGIRFDLAKPE